MKIKFKKISYLILLIYAVICIVLYFGQTRFLYAPDHSIPDLAAAQKIIPSLRAVVYPTQDGRRVYAWYSAPENAKCGVIFMHGNSYNVGYFISRIKPFVDAGYAVVMPEYQGFGGIPGTPSQINMERDVKATVDFMRSHGVQNKNIVLYGYSLGTYMATYTAAELSDGNPFKALILESPFTSLWETADDHLFHLFPIKTIIKDHYNSYDLIDKIGTRLFIAHGTKDPTVPFYMGKKMFDKAVGDKTFFEVEGANHRNLPENGFLTAVLDWLKIKK